MTEWFQHVFTWDNATTATAWLVTILLLICGVVGSLIPILPGHLFIFLAAISHRLMLGAEESGLRWWSFVILFTLMAASQAIEMLSGSVGTRWFGGTRWGAIGAFIGGIIGMFFFPFGIVLGPLIGAIACEMLFAKRNTKPAAISGVGSVVGTLTGIAVKFGIGLIMILWLLADILWIG